MRRAILLVALASAAGLATVGSATAAVFTVTRTDDPAPVACGASCSLREAVIAANAGADPDTILLPAGTYVLSLAGAGEDAAATGDLDLTDFSTIVRGLGAGAGAVTIDATALGDRIFDVVDGDRAISIANLTLRGGNGDGGALRNTGSGEVLAETVVFDRNNAPTLGGAILNQTSALDGARVVVRDSVFTGNTSAGSGGAIFNQSAARIVVLDSTFTGNRANNSGGALFNQNRASATLDRVRMTDNRAETNRGGAVFNQNESSLAIVDSTLDANQAFDDGGAIFTQNDSTLTLVRSTLVGNRANTGGGATATDGGGGIFAQNDSAVSLLESTLSGNTTPANGGGVFRRNDNVLLVRNSTISGNTAGLNGGGIAADTPTGQASLLLDHATIAFNSAAAGGGLHLRAPGGFAPFEPYRVRATIVARNVASGAANDCASEVGGVITSLDFNLDTTSTCGFGATGDRPGADPRLAALADNGGPTQTHALLAGSAAIDAGPTTCPGPAVDQRGVVRAQPAGGRCDVGAFEDRGADLRVSSADEPDPAGPTAQVAYRVAVANGGPEPASATAVTIRLPAGSNLVAATPSTGACGLPANGALTCDLGVLAAGAEALVTVTVTPGGPGELTLVATASSSVTDRSPAGNEATARTRVDAVSQPAPLTNAELTELLAALSLLAPVGKGQGGSLVPRRLCTVRGTARNDTLVGTPGNDVLCGLGGNDTIAGRGGRDVVDGGNGNDKLTGGPGRDVLLGLAGNDALGGGGETDAIFGGRGRDRLTGARGRDAIASVERLG
jgi:CSLREA domain-containing protein